MLKHFFCFQPCLRWTEDMWWMRNGVTLWLLFEMNRRHVVNEEWCDVVTVVAKGTLSEETVQLFLRQIGMLTRFTSTCPYMSLFVCLSVCLCVCVCVCVCVYSCVSICLCVTSGSTESPEHKGNSSSRPEATEHSAVVLAALQVHQDQRHLHSVVWNHTENW